jgi:putative salt-induced outer membrane protein YdiY
MKGLFVLFLSLAFLFAALDVFADEIYLKNNDRITGKIEDVNDGLVSVQTEAMGTVSVEKGAIKKIMRKDSVVEEKMVETRGILNETEQGKAVSWKGELSAGFNRTTGNTREDNFAGGFLLSRNDKHVDEWTLKGDFFYSSANRKMNKQKWYTMARYARSFGRRKKWYNFFRFETDHDRFADIDYRIVPSTGLGYWFLDSEDAKLMAEVGVAPEMTYYSDGIENTLGWEIIPRIWLEKKLFKKISLIQDFYYYQAVEDLDEYRLRSVTALDFKINDCLKLRVSLWDEYKSNPPKDTKKNDARFITSVAYSF